MTHPVHTSVPSDGSSKTVRLHYLDWLNVLAILAVFLFHATLPFSDIDYGIANEERSIWLTLFGLVLSPWGMALFFLLSGARSRFALRHRSPGQYMGERVGRLLVPFVIGTVLLSPFQIYLAAIHSGTFAGPFFSLAWFRAYLEYLAEPGLCGLLTPTVFSRVGVHLWFLAYLFIFALLSLPIFSWLKSDAGKRFVSGLAALCERRGGILLFAVPLVVIRLLLQPHFPEYTGWTDFTFMWVFFVAGYVLYGDARFTRAVQRDRWLAFIVGITGALFFVLTSEYAFAPGVLDSPTSPAKRMFYASWGAYAVSSWCMVISMLYVGMRFLDYRDRWLVWGQEALMAFYLLHQPVIFAVAFYVVQWQAGVWTKLAAVLLASFAITLALIEVVRRLRPLRALFGMKPR